MSDGSDVAEWAKAHAACFESEPLVEVKGSEKITAGFVLNLYARLPMELPPGQERQAAVTALWERLRGILESTASGQGGEAQLEIEPMHAAVLRPGNEMRPEITLRARIQHREAFQALTPAEREAMSAFEKKLVALGLRAGHW